jgi:hypothetical protein
MRISLSLSREDLEGFFRSLTPFRVELARDGDRRRWIEIAPPETVSISPAGLTVATSGRLQWNVAGLDLPVHVTRVEFSLGVSIDPSDPGVLCLSPRMIDADFRGLPAFVDRTVVKSVNGYLAERPLRWRFIDTLRVQAGLPAALTPPTRVDFRPSAGRITLQDGLVTLELDATLLAARAEEQSRSSNPPASTEP